MPGANHNEDVDVDDGDDDYESQSDDGDDFVSQESRVIVRVVLQPGLEDLQLPRDEELALEVNGDIYYHFPQSSSFSSSPSR